MSLTKACDVCAIKPSVWFPHRKRMAATELSKSMNEFLTKLQDDLKEAMNTMMCTKCEGKHKYVAHQLN